MSIKSDVLSILLEAKGSSVSGSSIARKLGISRNAVWKAVNNLKEEGYFIDAATNKGYCLGLKNNILSEQSIRQYLKAKTFGSKIDIFKTIDSTNTFAKKLAQLGAAEGSVVISEEQTAGKGRLGRKFFSPSHTGIYITIILRPKMPLEKSTLITSCAAVAVAKTIDSIANVNSNIKWVNDIYINDKKACGILTEAGLDFETNTLDYVIVGIGINVSNESFPEALKDIATSLFIESHQPINRSELVAELLNNLEKEYYDIENLSFLQEYRRRSNVIGSDITVLCGNNKYDAHAVDIDNDARLIVTTDDGKTHALNSGEVSVRKKC